MGIPFLVAYLLLATFNFSFAQPCHRILSGPAKLEIIDDSVSIVTAAGVNARRGQVRYEHHRFLAEYLSRISGDSFDLLDTLSAMNGENVILDFGSGEGFFAEQLHQNAKTVFARTIQKNRSALSEYLRKWWQPRAGRLLSPDEIDADLLAGYGYPREELNHHYEALAKMRTLLDREPGDKPRAVAITYEMRRTRPRIDGIKFLWGRLMEDIGPDEIPNFDLGISFQGFASYSKNLPYNLALALRRANRGGKLIIIGSRAALLWRDDTMEDFDRAMSGSQADLRTDRKYSLFERLGKRAQGIKVRYDKKGDFYVIERVAGPLILPEMVYEYSYGLKQSPPTHIFRFTGQRLLIE